MPNTPTAPIDTSRCPLCGGENGCAIARQQATGQDQPPCWCVSASFSAELLARLPADMLNAACICARCVADDARLRKPNASGA